MGTGWRRAFCTRDSESTVSGKQHRSSSDRSPRSYPIFGFISGGSNPSTPRLQKQQSQPASTPSLRCRTISEEATANESPGFRSKSASRSPHTPSTSNSPSPRTPLKLSIFKNSFKFRSSCGICSNCAKTGQGRAIYTAECGHAFHFPCIADHVSRHRSLVCPVCNAAWKDVPLLAAHKNFVSDSLQQNDVVADKQVEPEPPQQQQQHAKHSDTVRFYDDDEPLLSNTAGTQIMPIPEGDENDEEEDDDGGGEFQGFFVHPKSSSSTRVNDGDSRCVKVKLMPDVAVISVSRSHETYALVLRVKAPPPPPPAASARSGGNSAAPSQRGPIDLVTVLDVGGNMTGAKLHMLKRAMRLVISSLGSADRLSIVAFSAISKRLLPLRRMTAQGQREARRIIDRLACHQGTSVGDALKKATKVLEDRREKNPVASVVLLSDGHDERVPPNTPATHQCSSHVSSTRFAHIEIPVHAFGFGAKRDYSHEPAGDAFAKCVGGLLSVVVQDLRIQLGFRSDSSAAEISAIYLCGGRPTAEISSASVRLGDLYAEEERELLVELRVPASALGTNHVMTVRCLYKDPASKEIVYGREHGVLVPRPQSARSSSGTRIERLRNVFITTRAIAESRRVLEQNEFSSAYRLLDSARVLLMQSGSNSAEECVRGLEAEIAVVQWRRQQHQVEEQMVAMQRRRGNQRERERETSLVDENGEPLTPTSAWKAAEKLAKMAVMKKSLNRVSDLHGFENARF